MNSAEKFLQLQLEQRSNNGLFRSLSTTTPPIDFCSNDYLGFARSANLKDMVYHQTKDLPIKNGATGSRLLAGNSKYTEQTEATIATFHQAEAGLLFNSGYDANVGLLSSIPQRGDTIICDELIHASLIDGARLSHANRYKFTHNDVSDLAEKLKLAKGLIYVVIESVYSMDGDQAPLLAINALCQRYNANLIIDEAHAVGVFGEQGKGLVAAHGLTNEVFARIVTFGKALGTHGAIVLGSNQLRNYLINFARSFIYTTAASPHSIVAINCAYQLLKNNNEQELLTQNIKLYNSLAATLKISRILSESAIQTILIPGNKEVKTAAKSLQAQGFDVKAILSPTVPTGKERLRICLHAYNTEQEIKDLVQNLDKLANHG
jgi:8-amino-7-oxononanoate synthase